MTITVSVASTNTNFTTLDRVKKDLDSTGSTANDGYLQELIKEASDYIRTYTGREFARETVTEKLPKKGDAPRLMVSRTPLHSISFIEYDGSSVSSTSYEIEDSEAGIIWREEGFRDTSLYRQFISVYPRRFGRKDFKIKYEAGYKMPGSTDRDLPYDLERAAREIVTHTFNEAERNKNVTREEVGEASISYSDPADALAIPTSAQDRLERWTRADIHINS